MTAEEIAEQILKPDYMASGTWFNYKLGDEYKRSLKAIEFALEQQSTASNKRIVELIEAERVKNDIEITNSDVIRAAIFMGRNQQLTDLLKKLQK